MHPLFQVIVWKENENGVSIPERSETFAAAAGNSFVAAASTVVGVTDVPVDLVVDAEDVLAGFVLVDLVIGQCAHYLQMWFLCKPKILKHFTFRWFLLQIFLLQKSH